MNLKRCTVYSFTVQYTLHLSYTHTQGFNKNNSALYTLLGDVQRGVRFVVPGF